MKKVLASIGIGNATVDTVLPSETVRPGETIDAEVHITGGKVEQDIGAIRFEIETRYRTEDGYQETDIGRFTLAEGLTIEPGQEETRPVTIDIPYSTPITRGQIDVWIETELDIDLAVDPEDKDYLDVRPTPRLQAVFDAMDDLGFSLRSAECEADPYGRYTTDQRFIQEFEFKPSSGPFRGALDEIELVARPGPDELTLFVEVDRRGGLLSELADVDERKVQTTIQSADPSTVRDTLERLIEKHA
ncbi:sporulation protein [Haloferax sp. S1W]|uniref:sporulation protein n=1 Tax=Haloferax sp. S1W TaxID=3377110 RepID=UPI0037C8C721